MFNHLRTRFCLPMYALLLLLPAALTAQDRRIEATRRALEGWNQKDPAAIASHIGPGAVFYSNGERDSVTGPDHNLQSARSLIATYPDVSLRIHEVTGAGDLVVARWRLEGTHHTLKKKITIEGVTLARWQGDKVAEERLYYDSMPIMLALGYEVTEPKTE